MSEFDYDLFVIGAGSGGVRASRVAAQLGAKVAVAEERELGGTCVNVGCVPKKLFVYSSHFSEDFEAAQGFGWSVAEPQFDWPTLRDRKTAEIKRLNAVYGNILDSAGVTLYQGRATLSGPQEVEINGQTITAKQILIAVGGWPVVPNFPGSDLVITSNEAFYLEHFPKKVIVVGGGYIAVEFAGIFKGLGAETHLVHRGPMFLRGFDKDVRTFVAQQVEQKGVHLHFNRNIQRISKAESQDGQQGLVATMEDGSQLTVDTIMYATGRRAKTTGLGLENTQVKTKSNGAIQVNENYQTDEPSIYAIGDVIDRVQLTPVALAEGMILAHNLFGGKNSQLDYHNIPTAVFCQPNIATVGLGEEEAREKYQDVDIYQTSFRHMKHTLSGLAEKTMMKIIVDKASDKVLGCHMVGADAGEIIQGIAIAIRAGASKEDFDKTIGIHPTAAEEFVSMREPFHSQ